MKGIQSLYALYDHYTAESIATMAKRYPSIAAKLRHLEEELDRIDSDFYAGIVEQFPELANEFF